MSPTVVQTTIASATTLTPLLATSSTDSANDYPSSTATTASTTSLSAATTSATEKRRYEVDELEVDLTTIDTRTENTPPVVKTRLQKIAVTSGKSFAMTVPEDTFYDEEDMNNLRLDLTDRDGHELKPNSWLQFNAEERQIYGL